MPRQTDNWIKTYMAYTSTMEAPDPFHFWTAVSTIAGALRRRVWIDMGHFQWSPNFYIIFVAPPGIVSKSTTLSVGMKILKEIKDVKFGPDAVTCAALAQALAGSRLDVPIPGMEGFLPMSALTIFSSELGTFMNPHDREMIDVLVDLWDNRTGSWEKITKTSGSDSVVNPWVNLAACTTPAWIAGNFPDYLIGGGFTSRCVFVYAEKKRRLVAYPFLEMPVEEFKVMRNVLANDLQEIAKMGGGFKMNQDALSYGAEWYRLHYETANKELNNSQFAGYLARKQTHVHKLAMILAAAESNALVITDVHLRQAAAIITSLEADMPKVFSNIGQEGDSRNAMIVLDIIRAYGKIGKRMLFRLCASKMGVLEFNNAMESVIFQGYVVPFNDASEISYVYTPDKPAKPN